MLAIKLKRQAKAKAEALAAKQAATSAVNITLLDATHNEPSGSYTQPSLADRPWEETQAILKEDLSRLRTLSGSQEKDPYKEELIKKYRPVVEQLLETHQGKYGNLDVMWYWFMWQVDVGNLEQVHDAFRAAIDGGLETPIKWNSNGMTAYCDIIYRYSDKAHKAQAEFNRDYLINAVKDLQSGELATNAPLKVKMFKLVGDWSLAKGEKKQAHDLFEVVMKLDPKKGGRKTTLNELREELGYDQPN
ncbi:MAG: phage terminase small subunit [Pseudomonadota bacterium]